jgi:hypothetical protein
LVNNYVCNTKWCGIIHWVPNVPDYLCYLDVNLMFEKKNFIHSLNSCVYLITLSSYITKWLKNKLSKLNINIPIYTFKHPVDSDNILLFNFNNFTNNTNKKLMQVGQQLRKVTSIYLIDSLDYEKIWLTGTKNIEGPNYLLKNEITYLNIHKNTIDTETVIMKYTNVADYDLLLSENIVFVNLFDAGANNTVLECIIRNTPIIINKIEPVIEYLGESYPLYFEDLKDVPKLLINEKILEAHIYLTKLNKQELFIDEFTKKIINLTYSSFN